MVATTDVPCTHSLRRKGTKAETPVGGDGAKWWRRATADLVLSDRRLELLLASGSPCSSVPEITTLSTARATPLDAVVGCGECSKDCVRRVPSIPARCWSTTAAGRCSGCTYSPRRANTEQRCDQSDTPWCATLARRGAVGEQVDAIDSGAGGLSHSGVCLIGMLGTSLDTASPSTPPLQHNIPTSGDRGPCPDFATASARRKPALGRLV